MPDDDRPHRRAAGGVGAGIPGVDFGLAAVRQITIALAKPVQERDGLPDLDSGPVRLLLGDRLALGETPEPMQDVPGGEPGDDLLAVRIGDLGEGVA
jgi:hypothetical protein